MPGTTPTFADVAAQAQEQAIASLEKAQDMSIKALSAAAAVAPTPAELVEATFAFGEQVLAAQKSYALRLAALAAPAKVSAD